MIKTKESRKYVFNEKTRRANDASVKRSFGGNVPVSDFYQTRVIYDETKKKEKEDEKFVIEKLSRGPIWRQKNLFPFFYTRKFSRLATYYVTYIRSSNDTHH